MHTTTPLTVELTGSSTARHGQYEVNTAKGKTYKDPVCPLARLLIAEGFDPDTLVHVVRDWDGKGPKAVFKRDLRLSYWADHDYVDTNDKSAHRRKYVPFVAGMGVSRASAGSEAPAHPADLEHA
ncbi:hypothetical protein [Mesorhizobium escarrei]|uniref:Uncharacterized protein n=1 Tax=Mesorhizobium escarrei TaxID=666018 RepID=A0ABM9DTX4_9HYPH|nr:hypothetical protein [Mesorhizobium escarrei]CAH2399617.1 hypothetical protein MES5069_230035 [Mesorhizobium escarrei]